MCFFSLHLSAGGISQTVSFWGDDVPLKKVFNAITQQTGYVVVGNKQFLQMAQRVHIHLKNSPLPKFLETVFEHQPLTFTIIEKTIVVRPLTREELTLRTAPGADIRPLMDITGKITDERGQPLPALVW